MPILAKALMGHKENFLPYQRAHAFTMFARHASRLSAELLWGQYSNATLPADRNSTVTESPEADADLARMPHGPCTLAAQPLHGCRAHLTRLPPKFESPGHKLKGWKLATTGNRFFLGNDCNVGKWPNEKLRAGYVPRGTQPALFPSLLRRFSSGRSCLALRSYSASSSRSSSSSRYFSSISSSSYWSASLRPLMKLGASPM